MPLRFANNIKATIRYPTEGACNILLAINYKVACVIRLSSVILNKRKCPDARAEGKGVGGGGGGKSHQHPSLPFLRNAGAFTAGLSKKYLLLLEKQSTTPIAHYTFHYIQLIPVSAAVYREVKHVNLCLCSRGHFLRGITRYNCFKG